MAPARLSVLAATLALTIAQPPISAAVRVDVVSDVSDPGAQALRTRAATEANMSAWPKTWNEAQCAAATGLLGEWQDFESNVYHFEQVTGGVGFYDFRSDKWAKLKPSPQVYFETVIGGRPARFSLRSRKRVAPRTVLSFEVLEPTKKFMIWQRQPLFTQSKAVMLSGRQFFTPTMPTANAALARSLMGTWRLPLGKLKSMLGLRDKRVINKFAFKLTKEGDLAVVVDNNITALLHPSGVLFEGQELKNASVIHRFRRTEDGRVVAEKKFGSARPVGNGGRAQGMSPWYIRADLIPLSDKKAGLRTGEAASGGTGELPESVTDLEAMLSDAVRRIKAVGSSANMTHNASAPGGEAPKQNSGAGLRFASRPTATAAMATVATVLASLKCFAMPL